MTRDKAGATSPVPWAGAWGELQLGNASDSGKLAGGGGGGNCACPISWSLVCFGTSEPVLRARTEAERKSENPVATEDHLSE